MHQKNKGSEAFWKKQFEELNVKIRDVYADFRQVTGHEYKKSSWEFRVERLIGGTLAVSFSNASGDAHYGMMACSGLALASAEVFLDVWIANVKQVTESYRIYDKNIDAFMEVLPMLPSAGYQVQIERPFIIVSSFEALTPAPIRDLRLMLTDGVLTKMRRIGERA